MAIGEEEEPVSKNAVKNIIAKEFEQAVGGLGLKGFAVFGGFYNEATNARAATNRSSFRFNEHYLEISPEERERVIWHEAQHIQNYQQLSTNSFPQSELWRLFALHPIYAPIHARMMAYYQEQHAAGYPFRKAVDPEPPKSIVELGWGNINYADPDELLALLRGYDRFLRQGGESGKIAYAPYEFIPAFIPENLELLDLNFRHQLAREVIAKNPDVLVTPALSGIEIQKPTS